MSILRRCRKIKPAKPEDDVKFILQGVSNGKYGVGQQRFGSLLQNLRSNQFHLFAKWLASKTEIFAGNFRPEKPYRIVVKHVPVNPWRAGLSLRRMSDSAGMRIGQTAPVPAYAKKLWNDSGVNRPAENIS